MNSKMDATNKVEYVSSRGVYQRGEVVEIMSATEIIVLNHLAMPVSVKEWRPVTNPSGKIFLHLCSI